MKDKHMKNKQIKDLWINHKYKIIFIILAAAVLTWSFFWGGNYPKSGVGSVGSGAGTGAGSAGISTAGNMPASLPPSLPPETSQESDFWSAAVTEGQTVSPGAASPDASESAHPAGQPSGQNSDQPSEQASGQTDSTVKPNADALKPSSSSDADRAINGSEAYSESQGMEIDPKTGKDQYQTDPVPEGKPVPIEPQNVVPSDKKLTCTLSVRCDTILDNMELLDKDKWELVPGDGVIFPETAVTFYEGESVLNVLQREMKKTGIQMEFSNVPMYNSAYIEGINNLYEFDVGELSGWMYRVNGWFPNYGCSRYQLKQGDVVEWVYTCDLGKDVGGSGAVGGS